MACTWTDRDDVFEGYVHDALPAEDRARFEEHFFGCAACFDKLETYRALQMELREAVAEAPVPQTVAASRAWWWAPLATAAGVVLVAALTMWLRGSLTAPPETTVATAPAPQSPVPMPEPPTEARPAPSTEQAPEPAAPGRATPSTSRPVVALAVLARVEPPMYLPVALRGPRDEAAMKFEAAMKRYVEKDYAGAIPDLRAAVGLHADAPHAQFFLAICQLLTDQTEPAVEGLQKIITLGESAYLEEAHFYLAKARLRQGRLQDARDELTRAIGRRGRLEREARDLLTQVNALIGKGR